MVKAMTRIVIFSFFCLIWATPIVGQTAPVSGPYGRDCHERTVFRSGPQHIRHTGKMDLRFRGGLERASKASGTGPAKASISITSNRAWIIS